MSRFLTSRLLILLTRTRLQQNRALRTYHVRTKSVLRLPVSASSPHGIATRATQFAICSRSFSTAEAQEKSTGHAEKREFQAETRMLLDIVARSLYSEKEVFIRELISNASDALEKLRYFQLIGASEGEQTTGALEIKITTDRLNRTITIQDTGAGMTKEDLIEHLGTIARSGSKAFLEELQRDAKGGPAVTADAIIGQFGVGFYSSFMVAERVELYTRSYKPGSKGYLWTSDGSGYYELSEGDNVELGTKIVLHLKAGESVDFSDEVKVKEVIKKYSNFVSFPILVNGERVNAVQAVWAMDPKDVTEEMHEEFYHFITHNQNDKPRFTLHYKTDAPVNIRALLYVPFEATSVFDLITERAESGVSLYSRRVLIQPKAETILPKWLRFLKGVVDSEDIPLNLSRELLQQSAVVNKIRSVLTARVVKFFQEQMKKEADSYKFFYSKYGVFFKEGILRSSDQSEKEDIAKLLLFESSNQRADTKVTLSDYCSRMQAGQREIYYLYTPSRELAETSPYFEAMKGKNLEVLFCYDPADEVTMLQLAQFQRKTLVSLEKSLQQDKDIGKQAEGSLPTDDVKSLTDWIQEKLGKRKVFQVKTTNKLSTHPCLISVEDMSTARHFLRAQAANFSEDQRYMILRPTLEINPAHPLIKQVNALKTSDPELAELVMNQIYDNAMVTAGLIDDARGLVGRMNTLLEKALSKQNPAP